MNRRHRPAAAVATVLAVGAGMAHVGHNPEAGPKHSASKNERVMSLDEKRYAKMLGGTGLNVIGGMPEVKPATDSHDLNREASYRSEMAKVNPAKEARKAAESATEYILGLRKDSEDGLLPEGVKVESKTYKDGAELIEVYIDGVSEDKGVHGVSLSTMLDKGKNGWESIDVTTFIEETLANGERHFAHAGAGGVFKDSAGDNEQHWTLGYGIDSSKTTYMSKLDEVTPAARGEFVITTGYLIEDALAGAELAIGDLERKQNP